MERARVLTQPNVVIRAAAQQRQKFRAETEAAETCRGPQQKPSCEEKVLWPPRGAPGAGERRGVPFRGGREGDKVSSGAEPRVSSGAEPRGTSIRRERAHLPQPDSAEGPRLHTTPRTRAPGTHGQLTLIHPRSQLQSGGSRGALGGAAVPGGAWKRCQLATMRTHTRRPGAERGRGR